jgi:hypothetical protein
MQAKVLLFNAYQLPVSLPDSVFNVTPHELEKENYERLYLEAETIDPRRTVALETQCAQGPVNSSILSAAAHNNASYIVIGMKESGKEIRKYVGTTVTSLSKKSSIPLIVVPADATYSTPTTIALASDITDETDIHTLAPLKTLTEKFKSSLFVVRVIKKSMDEVVERVLRSESLNWFLKTVKHSFEFIKAENVAKALNAFVVKHAVNMVAVIPHEHTLFEKLFTRSVTKDLVFHSNVPLLILPDKKNFYGSENQREYMNPLYEHSIDYSID